MQRPGAEGAEMVQEMMMKAFVAAFAALSLGSAAFAGTVANPFAKDAAVLTLKGLDLSTADGQRRLAVRVDQAARAVCGDKLYNVHLELEARARSCRTDVAEQVRGQIDARLAQVQPAGMSLAAAN